MCVCSVLFPMSNNGLFWTMCPKPHTVHPKGESICLYPGSRASAVTSGTPVPMQSLTLSSLGAQIVGHLLYYRFMNPAVVAPDGFDIVDVSAAVALHPDHRRNLGSIAKVLQHAVAYKPFEGESAHLNGVNRYLEETHDKFRSVLRSAMGWMCP